MKAKKDLVSKMLSAYPALSKKKAEEMVNFMLNGMASLLKEEPELSLAGFGTFRVTDLPARTVKDISNPEKVYQVAPSKVIRFKAFKNFKDQVK